MIRQVLSAIICIGWTALLSGCLSPQPPVKPGRLYLVLPGDHADPTIVRDGNDFYLTHSSYRYAPALPIWHSTDLLHWRLVTYALPCPPGEIWAPDLVKYKGKFYIYFPAAGTNWVITADTPLGLWSQPVDLKLSGIDPGHLATPDGKRYLFVNQSRAVALADDGLSVISESEKVYDGWPIPADWVVEYFCDESPKLLCRNGFYYLTTAQGGTAGPATSHMVISARAKNPLGPWENSPFNPIVHTFSSRERWWSKGHGTVFDDAHGNWFIIYHAYEKDNLPLGRQVLIEPVRWTPRGWFRLARNPKVEPQTQVIKNPVIESDDFEQGNPKLQWQFSGLSSLNDVQLINGRLRLPAAHNGMHVIHAITDNPNYQATVRLELQGNTEAGLILYYDDSAFAGIAIDPNSIFTLAAGKHSLRPQIPAKDIKHLRLTLQDYNLSMAYSCDGTNFIAWPDSIEVSSYQHNVLGGFSSLKIGIYCKGSGAVLIDDFQYHPLPH